MGIRNGIDADIWDPENDQFLPQPYNADTVVEGKKAAREALRYRLGLTGWGDKPIVGVVSRLTAQKGAWPLQCGLRRTLHTWSHLRFSEMLNRVFLPSFHRMVSNVC